MYENNAVAQGAPTAPKKNNVGTIVCLIMIIAGVIMLVIGILIFRNSDVNKYGKVKDYSESFTTEKVKRLDLEIGWADLTVSKSTDDKIYIEAKNVPESFKAQINGDSFETRFNDKKFSFNMIGNWIDNGRTTPVVDIKVPEKEYDSFVLDLGAGETELTGLNCGKFRIDCGAGEVIFNDVECNTGSFECGAGEVDIKNLKCEDILYIDGGAGDVNITGSVLGGINVDQGVGSFSFSGTINGNIDADGGVGEIVFNLENPESDFVGSNSKYKLDIDTGVGSKTVNYGVSH